jgi:hypothetical protein
MTSSVNVGVDFVLTGNPNLLSTTVDTLLAKNSQTVATTVDADLNKQKTVTVDALVVDAYGSFRGTMTTVDRDALPALQPQDTVLNIDATTEPSGTNVNQMQYWTGSAWLSGQHMQAPGSGVTNLFVAPTTAGWRVELGDPTYPIRYWNGTTAMFTVDNAGDLTVTGAITGGSIDIPDTTTTNSFHVDSNGRMWIGKDGTHFSTAPFRVAATGIVTAKAATIQPLNSTSIALTLNDDQASSSPLVSLQSGGTEVGWISAGGSFISENSGSFSIRANTTDTGSLAALGPISVGFGPGGSSAVDVLLERSAARRLFLHDDANAGIAVEMAELASVTTPGSNRLRLYAKDKSGTTALYYKDDGGTEHDLSASGGTTFTFINQEKWDIT